MKKKQWITPELIVLEPARSEETVLTSGCKLVSGGSGPASNSQGCGTDNVDNCGACQGRSGGTS